MIGVSAQDRVHLDPMLSGVSAALVLVGVVAIASASVGYGASGTSITLGITP